MRLASPSLARGLPLRLSAIVAGCLLAFAAVFAVLVLRPATETLAHEQLRLSAGWIRAQALRDIDAVGSISIPHWRLPAASIWTWIASMISSA